MPRRSGTASSRARGQAATRGKAMDHFCMHVRTTTKASSGLARFAHAGTARAHFYLFANPSRACAPVIGCGRARKRASA
ncbi:hypothetical protein CO2235_MP40064 [Cupriavidus oxalaticus]|uniref:Uncharacterized protein n=1 Tax=Cupriavidus oxalaticus TaxID=96344 RepID=A0A976BHW7_9BURK|nr:hypothetical protein CO2235_MP40064 [Cupriavidus oxalaticus]